MNIGANEKDGRLQSITEPCPYCQSPVQLLLTSNELYHGHDYGPAWVCSSWPACDAYVGCHSGTTMPLGRLANKELRIAKKEAHAAFDRLWKSKMERDGCTKMEARNAGYEWLCKQLEMPRSQCHIGMMNLEQCKQVTKICWSVGPRVRR